MRHSDLDKGDRLVIALSVQQHICFDRRIEACVLLAQGVDLHTLQHIFRLVLPSHLRISARDPQLALRDHIRVVLVMIDDIIERTDSPQEIAFMEFRLA